MVSHVDVFAKGDVWWDNWRDFLGRASSKFLNIAGPFGQAAKSIAFPLRAIVVA